MQREDLKTAQSVRQAPGETNASALKPSGVCADQPSSETSNSLASLKRSPLGMEGASNRGGRGAQGMRPALCQLSEVRRMA